MRYFLSEIKNPGKTATIERVMRRNLSKSGAKDNLAAGFRWGGGVIVKNSRMIDILGVSRQLCYGVSDSENHAKVKRWTNAPWVRFVHDGAYIAKFWLCWTEDGRPKRWSSGNKTCTYEGVVDLPSNARNLTVSAQANSGKLWRSNPWVEIYERKSIRPQSTVTVTGTPLTGTALRPKGSIVPAP